MSGDGSFKATALRLLGVLPSDGTWLTLDDAWTAGDAHLVGITTAEHAEQLLRRLKRDGFVRTRRADDDDVVWQVTPSGADAAHPLTQTPGTR